MAILRMVLVLTALAIALHSVSAARDRESILEKLDNLHDRIHGGTTAKPEEEDVYKFRHFGVRFRGESIRWILSYAGVEWEDIRTDISLFPTLGSTLPVLEVNGKNLSQSTAIARYVARKHGFAGTNAWEEAQVDALADYVVIDVIAGFRGILEATLTGNQARAAVLTEEYTNKGVVPHLQTLERQLRSNHGGSGFFFGSRPTFADIIVVNFEDEVVRLKSTVLEKYPILQEHRKRIKELKGIKEWLAKRPETVL